MRNGRLLACGVSDAGSRRIGRPPWNVVGAGCWLDPQAFSCFNFSPSCATAANHWAPKTYEAFKEEEAVLSTPVHSYVGCWAARVPAALPTGLGGTLTTRRGTPTRLLS